MPHIQKKTLATGKIAYYPLIRYDGKYHSLGGYTTKRAAIARLHRAELEVAQTGSLQTKKGDTFQAFFDSWIGTQRKTLKEGTLYDYEATFRTHILPTFGNRPLRSITAKEVQAWLDNLPTAPATSQKVYRYFRSAMKQAEALGEIDSQPCKGIKQPRIPHKELDFLGPEEIQAVLSESSDPAQTFFLLLAYSGLRIGEALALRWRDVDSKKGVIRVSRSYSKRGGFSEPKTASSRRAVPMLPTLAARLKELQGKPDDLLFSLDGQPLDRDVLRRQFDAALKRAGIRHINLHSLRHSFATLMLDSGASIVALQRCLGHANASMTLDIYSHFVPESLYPVLERADDRLKGIK